jgi:hypothetical protein
MLKLTNWEIIIFVIRLIGLAITDKVKSIFKHFDFTHNKNK